MSRVSSDLKRSTKLTSLLANAAPSTRARIAKATSLTTTGPIPAMSAWPVLAAPASTESSTTAAKSSTTRIPTISRPRVSSSCPDSRSMVIRIAELLMLMAAPRTIASMSVQPRSWPISKPRANMTAISTEAISITLAPTSRMRRQPHSRPMPNSRSTRPSSASSPMVSSFCTAPRTDGPMSTPTPR